MSPQEQNTARLGVFERPKLDCLRDGRDGRARPGDRARVRVELQHSQLAPVSQVIGSRVDGDGSPEGTESRFQGGNPGDDVRDGLATGQADPGPPAPHVHHGRHDVRSWQAHRLGDLRPGVKLAFDPDAKTIERWIVQGRTPYRRHRYAVAAQFGVDESYLWPDALNKDEVAAASESEIVSVYPHRWAVPREIWGHLFGQAEREIGVLVYSAIFLGEDAGLKKTLADKASAGVRVRMLRQRCSSSLELPQRNAFIVPRPALVRHPV